MPLSSGNVAVVTGAASGIGLAAAQAFAGFGLNVVLVDLAGDRLEAARDLVAASASGEVMAVACDVASREAVEALAETVFTRFGFVSVLMNNAGIQPGSSIFGDPDNWRRTLAVNLGGIVNGAQVFGARMLATGRPGLIINTGSKQGITTPPGDPAYNVSKAGVKAFTEALEHELRNAPGRPVTAHLLIPGFVFTPLAAKGRADKPAAAWTAAETVAFMLQSLERGDFYILCPDNDVTRALDEKRMAWAMGDIIENRPPLSRWHADYKDSFATYIAD